MEDVCDNKLPKGLQTHKYVIDYYNGIYGAKTNRRRLRIADNLKIMRNMRAIADYNNKVQALNKLRKDAQLALLLSGDMLHDLRTAESLQSGRTLNIGSHVYNHVTLY